MPLDDPTLPARLPSIIRSPFRARMGMLEMRDLSGGPIEILPPLARRHTIAEDRVMWTLADVLRKLRGLCGRGFLLQHIKRHPYYEGRPTHRRAGRKLLWRPSDFENLLESLAPTCPVEPPLKSSHAPARKRSISEAKSSTSPYTRALELLTPSSRKKKGPH
jgi:hypothetical protein